MKPKPPLEREIVLMLLQYLQRRRGKKAVWIRVEPPSAVRARANRGRPGTAWKVPEDAWGDGVADIIGIYKTIPIAFEVKRPGKPQRESQVKFQERWQSGGGLYAVVTSIEDVEAAFTRWSL